MICYWLPKNHKNFVLILGPGPGLGVLVTVFVIWHHELQILLALYQVLYPSTWYCTIVVYMYLSAQLHRTAVGFAHRRAGISVGAVPAVQRAPPAHAPQRAPPRSQRVAAWRVAASLPYGALPAVRAPRRASSRPPPSWRPPAPRESCAARAARARRPSSRPHRTRTSRAQRH